MVLLLQLLAFRHQQMLELRASVTAKPLRNTPLGIVTGEIQQGSFSALILSHGDESRVAWCGSKSTRNIGRVQSQCWTQFLTRSLLISPHYKLLTPLFFIILFMQLLLTGLYNYYLYLFLQKQKKNHLKRSQKSGHSDSRVLQHSYLEFDYHWHVTDGELWIQFWPFGDHGLPLLVPKLEQTQI